MGLLDMLLGGRRYEIIVRDNRGLVDRFLGRTNYKISLGEEKGLFGYVGDMFVGRNNNSRNYEDDLDKLLNGRFKL